ncbi:MAG: alpha/beta hydrolase [Longicatena sp.]
MMNYIVCGNILDDVHVEEELKKYQDHRPQKKENVGPYVQGYDIGAQRVNNGYPNIDISKDVNVESIQILEMNVRIYRSKGAKGALPCICYLHGGGFCAGSLDAVEHPCKRLAELSSSCVISLDYGLAPEYPFPYAIHQCFEVTRYLYEHAEQYNIDKNHIALAGDSAGANIALGVAQLDAAQSSILSFLMLYYPVVDQRIEKEYTWEFAYYGKKSNPYIDACVTSLKDCEKMFQVCYLQGSDSTNTLASPILLETLKGLPPIRLCVAEFDYLRVSQEKFYQKFKEKHDIELICYAGVNHAFLDKLGVFPQADHSLKYFANQWKDDIGGKKHGE